MKYIDFPVLGLRPTSEFSVAGVLDPEPADLGEIAPGDWVFNRNSVPLERSEWWYHTPTQLWFIVKRDTALDTIVCAALARPDDGS